MMTPESEEVAFGRVVHDEGRSLIDTAAVLAENWKSIVAAPVLAGLVALGITYLVPPTFTARTTLLLPQPEMGGALGAMASLSALSGLVTGGAGTRTPAEQYVALVQSTTVADALIDRFDLQKVYDKRYRADARRVLGHNLQVGVGKKDGLITIEVDDEDPKRAAEMARASVQELRSLTARLAISEAQQRRVFFETQLKNTRDELAQAQRALQASGFAEGALKAEPKAAADAYAKLKAETTAAEVRLQALRSSLSENAAEVRLQEGALSALRGQLAAAAAATAPASGPDYVSKYREFKYLETLFEAYARQYELARADEAREGALIQVVDEAKPPEKHSWPKRMLTTIGAALVGLALAIAVAFGRDSWRRSEGSPEGAARVRRLRAALGRR